MGMTPRRALRVAAVAVTVAGGLLLAAARPVAATQPPPPTASTAVQVAPATAAPGTAIAVTGQGFAPSVGYTLMLCPAPACAPGAPAQKCAVPTASNTGTVLCNVEIPQDDPPGDQVVTVYQDIAAGSPAATACPAPLASPVATVPPLPAALPSPPAAPPVPLPNPGDQVTPCVRQASAVLTVLPVAGDDSLPPPLIDLTPPATLAPAPLLAIPVAPAPVLPVATPQPAPKTVPVQRPVTRAVAVSLPTRSLLAGLVLTVLGTVIFAGSLIPAPVAPGGAATAGAATGAASRLRRFVQSIRR